MHRSLVGLALALVAVGCSADSGGGSAGDRCASSRDCTDGRICVDARCVPGSAIPDAGGRDGGERADRPASDAPPPDAVCAGLEHEARERRRPIDVIVLPDESASMGPARDAVAAAMQGSFRDVMEAAGADYHVIWHGSTPLPALAGRVTYNTVLLGSGSGVMFKPVLDTYASWRPSLRDEAIKVFVHFTDATSGDGGSIDGYSGMFDEVLVSLEPAVWGVPGALRFSYHTFVGLTPNTPPEAPYEPADAIVSGTCSGSFVSPGPLQEMARRTGGLRFPLCLTDAFGSVFRRIAESTIERTAIPCEIELPTPPMGMTLDVATVAVRYTSGAGTETVLRRAPSAAECDAMSFTIEMDRIVLCPAACAALTSDAGASLMVLSGCDPALY